MVPESIKKYFDDFSPVQLKQLELLYDAYSEWNQKINVISRKDIESLYEKHVLHSLSIAACFKFAPGSRVLDLGTGGGFPGIPLSIFFPDTDFLLVDSIAKKLKVIDEVVKITGITNVTTRHSRVEDLKNEKFDFVVSRAVAPLKQLWQWCRPLLKNKPALCLPENVKPGLICLKGGDLANEISESGLRPRQMQLSSLFEEPYFIEKYILYVPLF